MVIPEAWWVGGVDIVGSVRLDGSMVRFWTFAEVLSWCQLLSLVERGSISCKERRR